MPAAGPVTAAGKSVSSRNAVKHGLLSEAPVVTRLESQEDWQSYRDGVVAGLLGTPASGTSPSGVCHLPFGIGHSMQLSLAERAALLMWRLRRVACAEADAVNAGLEELELDHKLVDARELAEYYGSVVALARGLAEFPDEHRLPKGAVSLYLDCASHALGLDSTRLAFPGIGKSEAWEGQLTAAQVRAALAHLGSIRGLGLKALYGHALACCESEAEPALRKYAELALRHDHRARARCLPDEKRLETLSRYEAHLGRELSRTMKALKDLQSRPSAEQSPLSNLQSPLSNGEPPHERTLNGSTPLGVPEPPILSRPNTPVDRDAAPRHEVAPVPAPQNCETNSIPPINAPETPLLQHSHTPANSALPRGDANPVNAPSAENCETNSPCELTPEGLAASFPPPAPPAAQWEGLDSGQLARLANERNRIHHENRRRYEETLLPLIGPFVSTTRPGTGIRLQLSSWA